MPTAGPCNGAAELELPRFREQACEAASAHRELGAALERPRLRRPTWRGLRAGLALRGHRQVPVQLQSQVSDCGPASLLMALGYYGINASLEQLRLDTDCGRDGVSARVLLNTARRYGLPGRGVRSSLAGLADLRPGSILFWRFNHFVVLERASADYLYVVDPAYGRRRLRAEDGSRLFTGVALEFEAPLPSAKATGTRDRPRSPWRYLTYFFPRSRKWLPLAAASLALLVLGLVTPFATAYVVDNRGLGDGPAPIQAVFAVAMSALSFLLLQLVRGIGILELQTLAEKRVTLAVFNRLLSLPYGFFSRRAPGDLAMRVRTSSAVRQILTNSMLSLAFDGVLVLSYLAMLFVADCSIAALVLGLVVVQSGVLGFAWRQQVYLAADALELQAQTDSELNELLEGIDTVKAGGLDEVLGGRWAHSLVEELNARTRARRHFTVFASLVGTVQFVAPLVVLVIGAVKVSHGELRIGEMTAFTSLSMGVFMPLTGLIQNGLQVAGLKAPLTRLGDILDAEADQSEPLAAGSFSDEGDLTLKGVRFSYPGARKAAVSGMDLVVPARGFIVVLGASGCGKSTLAMLLSGLLTPSEGRILIGDRSFDDIDRASLRRSISFVNQSSRIFAGSIRENITMGLAPGSDEDDLVWASKVAQIHDEITGLPMAYETLLGSGGAGLSGGQRQRIALARALVRRPKILILDEATSALDRATEQRVLSAIRELDCTLVVITHRLAAAVDADEVVLISEGRIIQRGNHQELGSTPGPYRSLVASSDVVGDRSGLAGE
ncbi:peptidase domain-containing ABC transporter [Streptomyces luteogriseus]|uniref:peptidase domain-containing ABC transporter n=1 Tax=Streptomyces luteogriseus TaxID=68233 RepID=UPI0037BCB6FA